MLNKNQKKISAFQLAMITLAFVASIRVLPTMAEYGLSCLFYYFIAIMIFLIPSALISAELATAWPERGGVYVWVKEALGVKWGFLAIWLQFLTNIIVLPAFLSFVAATTAYLFFPSLANNKYFLIAFILISFWSITLCSFRGMETAGWMNSFGSIVGTYIPLAIIILLGAYWILSGKPSQVNITAHAFIPQFSKLHLGDLVFLAGMLFSLTGMETSGAHALDVENVGVNYPKGIFLAILLIAIVGFGAISVATVVPLQKLSLTAGTMQAVTIFFDQLHLHWMIKVFAFMIVAGSLGAINSSVIGPAKGLFGAATGGEIPPILTKTNDYGMPINMFLFQAIAVSIVSAIFLLMPTVNASYWIIADAVTIIYMLMYLLLFISGIRLRYSHPEKKRYYRVPFGNFGMWVLGIMGLISTTFGIFIAFLPPSQIETGNILFYELTIIISICIFIGIGMLIYALRKPEWVIETN